MKYFLKKLLFERLPFLKGKFPYFGSWVFFPVGSSIFSAVCRQGIYEMHNVQLLKNLVNSRTCMFDVGANIGLMSLPVLSQNEKCRIISFEPSPNAIPYLSKTINASKYKRRWKLIKKAVGAKTGKTKIFVSQSGEGVLDSIAYTRRASGKVKSIQVEITTLDHVWKTSNFPNVSVIKIDVEGWESSVLKGAKRLIKKLRPFILLEWNKKNLNAAGIKPSYLINFTKKIKYTIFKVPEMIEVNSNESLDIHMITCESFLLVPKK